MAQQQATSVNDTPIEERLAEAESAAQRGLHQTLESVLPGLIADLGNALQELLPIASALVARADFIQADAILLLITTMVPDCFPAFEAFAMSAFHRRDWTDTISRWRITQAAFPDRPRPPLWLAGALQATQRLDEAEEVLCVASARFPNDCEIARDLARLPLARGNVEEAVSRFAVLRERFPNSVDGFALGAETLRTLGRFEEAEALLEAVRSQFEGNFHYNFQSAWNAVRLGRWEEAFRRWDVLFARHPHVHGVDTALGDTIMLWHLAKAEGDIAALHAKLPDEIARRAGALPPEDAVKPTAALSSRELLMGFEGLGDRCEFGLVQRHFGAEPISLLRWSGIEPKDLIAVLECRFEGVGESANTFVRLNPQSKEYFAGDKRFFYMHTFIKENEGSEQILFTKFCNRLTYLKRKLLADLEAGEKMFVYKAHMGELSDADANAISNVLARHFPASRIMLMRLARNPSEIGTVVPLSNNSVWAFLSRFSENLDSRFIRFDEWQAVCVAGKQYFNSCR